MTARLLLAAVIGAGVAAMVGCQAAPRQRACACGACATRVPDPEFYGHAKTCWRPWNDAAWSQLCGPACIDTPDDGRIEILELLDAPRRSTDSLSPPEPEPAPPPLPAP